jgi:YVTN family beta-propeller protein
MLWGIAVNPTGTKVYVADDALKTNTIHVIDTATKNVIDIDLESVPYKVAISPDEKKYT